MTLRNKLLIIAALFLGGLTAGNALAASNAIKESGIGGTGSPAMRGGIGGTGSAAKGIGGTGSPANGGIGGTGLRPNDEPAMQALAGKVLFVIGQVEVQSPGQLRTLAKGDPVRAGDTLKSGKGATLQLRMEDGGTIVLRPESQLAIESFSYKGVQDGSEHMALALLNGGFRAVTGEIGHLHKENYSIRTPNAKVGILGTDHETVFVSTNQPGQAAGVEPGTYNHVYSGATLLQSDQSKLLIKPNQTGFASLNGTSPIILDRPLAIFGDLKTGTEEAGEHHGGMSNDSGKESKESTGSSDSIAGTEHKEGNGSNDSILSTEHNSKGAGNNGSPSGTEHNWNNPTPDAGENQITQPDHLRNSPVVDLNNFEADGVPAASGSAVVGTHMAGTSLSVGSARAGSPGETLFVDDHMPGSYTNNVTGFNFIAKEGGPVDYGTAQVDGVKATWGIYAEGIAFDMSGNANTINYHAFAYTSGGATPLTVVGSMHGDATFSNVAGYTKPVTESGNLGGNVNLNVGINFDTSSVTRYNLAVTDANSRNWTGTLNKGPVALATFAQTGAPLAVNCVGCGSGTASGAATAILIGPNAKGLISSYALSTTTGQTVAGAAIISRP